MEDRPGCLVPLRFGYTKPDIPWSPISGAKERRVEYKLNMRPPMGIMSRFIVKTHHMIAKTNRYKKGVYWYNGVFLRMGEGEYRSEALCEFDNENKILSFTVRAAFPQNMIEQLHGFAWAVFSFFEGLKPDRHYGCIKVQENEEERCDGKHAEEKILFHLSKERGILCEEGVHEIDPRRLVYGFTSFGRYVTREDLRKELDKEPKWAEGMIRDVFSSITEL